MLVLQLLPVLLLVVGFTLLPMLPFLLLLLLVHVLQTWRLDVRLCRYAHALRDSSE